MTIICAARVNDRTWIGSDTQYNDRNLRGDCGPKWVIHRGWAVGSAGSLRTGDVILQNAERLFSDLEDPADFAERVRSLLGEYGFDLKPAEDDAPPNCGADMLLAGPSGIWGISGDFSIVSFDVFAAEGSGRSFAYGAYHAARRLNEEAPAKQLVSLGVSAAVEFDLYSGGDIWAAQLFRSTQ